MHETEQLPALIGDIYDAALDPALRLDVLKESARFTGGQAASVYSKDAVDKAANVVFQFGLDPQYVRLYLEKYSKLDPTATSHFFAQIGDPIATADVMPYDEFLETRFCREWAQPQGLVDTANAMLEKSLTSAAFFVVFRHERNGVVDDEMRRRMRLITPHFRRAVLIGKLIDLKKAEAASLADTLDGISAGMFLADAAGRIVHANAAGHAMLKSATVLRVEGGRLIANDPEAGQTLAGTFATAGNGDAAVGIKGAAVPLIAREGERYVAHVLPLTSGARPPAGWHELRRCGRAVRAQGGAWLAFGAGGDRQSVQTDAHGIAGIACYCGSRRRSRSR